LVKISELKQGKEGDMVGRCVWLCLRLNNEDHCLKVLGLEALKTVLYLLWLGL
jgi:hypothetical protein